MRFQPVKLETFFILMINISIINDALLYISAVKKMIKLILINMIGGTTRHHSRH